MERLELCFGAMRTPRDIVEKYQDLQQNKDKYANKKRKEMEKEIQKIKDNNKYVDQDLVTVEKYNEKVEELTRLKNQYDGLKNCINNDVKNVLYLLREEGFLVTLTNKTKLLFLFSKVTRGNNSPSFNLFLILRYLIISR